MPYYLFDYDSSYGEGERAAEAWLRAHPPGTTACSCGAPATLAAVTGGAGAARATCCFEPYCGDGSHLTGPLPRLLHDITSSGARWTPPGSGAS